jgi:hypothetical protein
MATISESRVLRATKVLIRSFSLLTLDGDDELRDDWKYLSTALL